MPALQPGPSKTVQDKPLKLANTDRIGTVKEIDYDKDKVKVKIDEVVTDFLPWIASRAGENASWSPLSIGEQVIILSPVGELSGSGATGNTSGKISSSR